ncbi:unnamed protein product, partial [Closterium sp. NIES-54]
GRAARRRAERPHRRCWLLLLLLVPILPPCAIQHLLALHARPLHHSQLHHLATQVHHRHVH